MTNNNLPFKEHIDLKKYCTLGIGGPARYFQEIHSIAAMQEAILICKNHGLQFMVLGRGSNCLFHDEGFNGVILLNKIDFCEELSPGTFHVGAGYNFSLLGVHTARQGWGGLEFASGIPASVGGAIFMNAGANGSETCTYLDSVDFVDDDGILKHYNRKDLTFSYRHSPFQHMHGAIVGGTFTLPQQPTARQKQIDIINMRTKTQPYGSKSAGCIFLNPPSNSAGALIDRCGLKGTAVGGAEVSTIHANFLINAQEATCKDILTLIELVKNKVKEEFNIELQSEVRQIMYQREEL